MRLTRVGSKPRGWTKEALLWLSALLLGWLAALQIQVVLAVLEGPPALLWDGCAAQRSSGACEGDEEVVVAGDVAALNCGDPGCDAGAVAGGAALASAGAAAARATGEGALESCGDPQVLGLLQRLADRCAGSFDSCPEGDLTSFAVAAEDFDDVVRRFPGTVTLHFPSGTPPIRTRAWEAPWPPADLRAHYMERLERLGMAERLRAAKSVLLIGRASQGGSAGTNNLYAKARANAAYELLSATLTDEAERAALGAKVKRLILSDRRPLAPEFFAAHHVDGMITWSPGNEAALRSLLKERDGGATAWARDTINQVAFVVPIACELPPARSVLP
ncbi:MAG: hypothetical protein IPK80_36140 [Nannocystis sp.]|nr:hypothetical protein [Nannocystis sp.]